MHDAVVDFVPSSWNTLQLPEQPPQRGLDPGHPGARRVDPDFSPTRIHSTTTWPPPGGLANAQGWTS